VIVEEIEAMATSKVPMSTTEDLRQVAAVLAGEILWGFVVTGRRDGSSS
jgi:hypothetical protein